MFFTTLRALFSAPFKREKRAIIWVIGMCWASTDIYMVLCSYLRRVLVTITDWQAIAIILGGFLFLLLYFRLRTWKKPRSYSLQRAYIWSLRQSQTLQSKALWYKIKFYFTFITTKLARIRRALSVVASKHTISDETLEKRLAERHSRNILNRHR